ncbi:MAG: hypothetical protein WAU02_01550 [Candidatus Saccharimonadales bacterium]
MINGEYHEYTSSGDHEVDFPVYNRQCLQRACAEIPPGVAVSEVRAVTVDRGTTGEVTIQFCTIQNGGEIGIAVYPSWLEGSGYKAPLDGRSLETGREGASGWQAIDLATPDAASYIADFHRATYLIARHGNRVD